MGMERTIVIDGRPVRFRASAAIPRIYRNKYRRDIFQDLQALYKGIKTNDEAASGFDIPSLELFENIAYIMAKHADVSVPDTVEEWLDKFDTFSIYQILPEIVELWNLNLATMSESKKVIAPPSGS